MDNNQGFSYNGEINGVVVKRENATEIQVSKKDYLRLKVNEFLTQLKEKGIVEVEKENPINTITITNIIDETLPENVSEQTKEQSFDIPELQQEEPSLGIDIIGSRDATEEDIQKVQEIPSNFEIPQQEVPSLGIDIVGSREVTEKASQEGVINNMPVESEQMNQPVQELQTPVETPIVLDEVQAQPSFIPNFEIPAQDTQEGKVL